MEVRKYTFNSTQPIRVKLTTTGSVWFYFKLESSGQIKTVSTNKNVMLKLLNISLMFEVKNSF